MSISATEGPLVSAGQFAPVPNGTATAPQYNPEYGPSIFAMGHLLLDPRYGFRNGGSYNGAVLGVGWSGAADNVFALNATPSALAANNIAASQTPVAATPLTLVSATGAGVTVLAAAVLAYPLMTSIPAGTLALDGAGTIIAFGQAGSIARYSHSTILSRNVRITSVGDDRSATFTVAGYDAYGDAMTETITGANTGQTASGAKAFKYITSITPAGTLSGSAVTVGTGDVFGIPVYASAFGLVRIIWNNGVITASTGFTAGVTTTPSATTGDVRGTYAVQSASDGTKTLQIYVNVLDPSKPSTLTGLDNA